MTTGAVYRICRRCGATWNVSALEPGEKRYVCPVCDLRARLARRHEEGARGDG